MNEVNIINLYKVLTNRVVHEEEDFVRDNNTATKWPYFIHSYWDCNLLIPSFISLQGHTSSQ